MHDSYLWCQEGLLSTLQKHTRCIYLSKLAHVVVHIVKMLKISINELDYFHRVIEKVYLLIF